MLVGGRGGAGDAAGDVSPQALLPTHTRTFGGGTHGYVIRKRAAGRLLVGSRLYLS